MNTKLYDLLSTDERIKILGDVLYKTEVRVNETAKEIGLSKGLVSKYFDILVAEGVLIREENVLKINGGYKTRALKIMLNVLNIPEIFEKHAFIKAAGLYGSAARGTNTKDSDIDLWIKVDDIKNKNIPKINAALIQELGETNILFLDNAKLEEIKNNDKIFYHSLHFGSITIYGDDNEM
ncbi:MAG: nucleotidyltransferase domain-containing protein [archaeon]